MSDPSTPYSEATVELVARALHVRHCMYCTNETWTSCIGFDSKWQRTSARDILDALAAVGRLLPEGAETRTEHGVEFTYPGEEPRTLLEPSLWVAEQTVALGVVGHAYAARRLMQRTSWSTPWSAVPSEPKEGAPDA